MTDVWVIFLWYVILLMHGPRLIVVEFCETQCKVVVSNESELIGCLLVECEGSNTVLYFELS